MSANQGVNIAGMTGGFQVTKPKLPTQIRGATSSEYSVFADEVKVAPQLRDEIAATLIRL